MCLFTCLFGVVGCRSSAVSSFDASPISIPIEGRVLSIEDVDERWRPALEALRSAVDAGDDREARAVLERLYLTEPVGDALEVARAYERILDGREIVAGLELSIDAQFERTPESGGTIVVWFKAASNDVRTLDVAPGPCTLRVTQIAVDADGDETRSVETLPLAAQIRALVTEGAPVAIPIAHMPFQARKGALASRATFELELRAGAVFVEGRELPAMRWRVAPGEVVLLARDLANLELSSANALAEHVSHGKADAREALSIAVRVPRVEREAAIDELARVAGGISEQVLVALAPALMWLAPEENLGRDADAWRGFLRRRVAGLEKRRDLVLPRGR